MNWIDKKKSIILFWKKNTTQSNCKCKIICASDISIDTMGITNEIQFLQTKIPI